MKNRTTINTTGEPKNNRTTGSTTPKVDMNKALEAAAEGAYMSMLGGSLAGENQKQYEGTPFKNKAIDLLNMQRRKLDVSREFDGKNVEGTMTVRPTIGGGIVETERYNIPDAGTVRTKTRFDKELNKVREVKVDNSNNNLSRFLNKENWKRKTQDVSYPGESGYVVGSERPTLSGGKVKRSNQKITYTEGPRAGTTEIIKSRTTISKDNNYEGKTRLNVYDEKGNLLEKSKVDSKRPQTWKINRPITAEMDGVEVSGVLKSRKLRSGREVTTERLNAPGGGTRTTRTSYNKKGEPVNRTVKDRKINKR